MSKLSKEERKKILEEIGYNKDDMKRFWNECLDAGVPAIKALDKSGLTWKDLTKHQLRQLPTVKETWLKKQDQVRESVEDTPAEELTFEEEMFKKIQSGANLSERELQELVWSGLDVDEIEGDDLRWTRCMTTIVKLCDHYYSIEWLRGLTENQENEFYYQPQEVKPVKKMVKMTDWIGIDKEIEKQPVYLEVPCNVGDTVYMIGVKDLRAHLYKGTVSEIKFSELYDSPLVEVNVPELTHSASLSCSDFGEVFFLENEKEKAEAACVERQKLEDIEASYYDDDFEEDL